GLVLNRTHPVLADLPAARAETAAEMLEQAGTAPLAAAVLRLHADRVALAGRERRLLARFHRAHPAVPVVAVPALTADVHDLPALRDIGGLLAGEQLAVSRD
ncbi:MAG: ArsA family ATPase, partial [Pseudonocardiaceae bacterium]